MSDPVSVAQTAQEISLQWGAAKELLAGAAYLMGAMFGIAGMMKLMAYRASDGRSPLSSAVAPMAFSLLLLSAPYLMDASEPSKAGQASQRTALALAEPKAAEAQFTIPAPEQAPLAAKEPEHGASGDMRALMEVLSLFAALGLGGVYFIARAAKRGEARRELAQAALAGLTAAPSGQAAREPSGASFQE